MGSDGSMVIKNVRLHRKEGLFNIRIEDGAFAYVGTAPIEAAGATVVDGGGHLALPPFIDPHVHLDSVLTAGEPRWNESGTLFEGIERWSERKALLTREDVKKRAGTILKWYVAQGVQAVRTHVDVTDPALTALKALVELREEYAPYLTLQIVAFPQEGILSFPDGKGLMLRAIEEGVDVLGAIPHYEFTREYGVESLRFVAELAEKRKMLVDVHCDEIDDEQSRFVEVLAAEAYQRGIGSRVTASHTTAMHSYNNAYAFKLFGLLKKSGINFIANPLVNIHLQGRFDSYPKRRGVTRVKELLQAGINACFGHDDIVDPWYPMGSGNMLQTLFMGVHVCQLMGYEELIRSMDLITVNSAKTLCMEGEYGIEEGKPGNLIVLPVENAYQAIRMQTPPRLSVRRGKVIAERGIETPRIYLNEAGGEEITFTKADLPR
jgi:cytosine deaminase